MSLCRLAKWVYRTGRPQGRGALGTRVGNVAGRTTGWDSMSPGKDGGGRWGHGELRARSDAFRYHDGVAGLPVASEGPGAAGDITDARPVGSGRVRASAESAGGEGGARVPDGRGASPRLQAASGHGDGAGWRPKRAGSNGGRADAPGHRGQRCTDMRAGRRYRHFR